MSFGLRKKSCCRGLSGVKKLRRIKYHVSYSMFRVHLLLFILFPVSRLIDILLFSLMMVAWQQNTHFAPLSLVFPPFHISPTRICPSVVNPTAVAGSERRSKARLIQSKRTEFVCPSSTVVSTTRDTVDLLIAYDNNTRQYATTTKK